MIRERLRKTIGLMSGTWQGPSEPRITYMTRARDMGNYYLEVPRGWSQKVLYKHKAFLGSGTVVMGTGCQATIGKDWPGIKGS